jgi:hypothetical protein
MAKYRTNRRPGPKAGWNIDEWCDEVGIARNTYDAIPDALKPKRIKLSTARVGRVLIYETPKEYLERRAAMQAAEPSPPKRRARS